jgi:hypothetical protein
MALMIARFLRFYPGYDDTSVMRMSARRFFVLNAKINRLLFEEEAVALSIAHNSKPGDRLKELLERMKQVERGAPSAAIVLKATAGEASYEEEPGAIAALRERQKAVTEDMKKDREAWLAAQKVKMAQPPAST